MRVYSADSRRVGGRSAVLTTLIVKKQVGADSHGVDVLCREAKPDIYVV